MELKTLSDGKLLSELVELVRIEKETTLKVLEYLSEVDSRMLWKVEGYSSLFDFCVRHLKYSEGEVQRRIQGCRLLVKFDEVRPLLENDELSLTSLCLLSPHLTANNIAPLLNEAKNQTTRQVEKIIENHFPDTKKKAKLLVVELDEELEALMEKAKLKLSEKMPEVVLKRILRDYLKPKTVRTSNVKKHTQYIPEHIKRAVRIRDNDTCTYKSTNGVHCNQRYHLEYDHIIAYAKGGSSHDINNIRLLCKVHNLMKAKQDYPNYIPREMHREQELKGQFQAAMG